MLETGTILFIAFGYMGLLFAIAYYGDRSADAGRSIISNPYIYALSMAVYCTAWTFYGSVGRAAATGIGFLPVYIGPTLAAALGFLILRKLIRISKVHRITSIADFIASRYGKSTLLAAVVTVIAALGIVPYIALQLKAVSQSYLILRGYPQIHMPKALTGLSSVFADTALYVALLLALFAVLFGTRHLDATERHEGLVAAIAFESVVKLVAFLAVGIFVTYGIYDGFGDLFSRSLAMPELASRMIIGSEEGAYVNWTLAVFLSMMAVLFLPRQFQVAVVENVDENHLNRAIWLFPLYLLAINIFVLPVAFGGVMLFPDKAVDADTFMLTIPMVRHEQGLALFAFLGGMSAATGMVIVETVALSTMICNDLVMPLLLRLPFLRLTEQSDLSVLLLAIRRAGIVLVLLLGYAYYHFIGEHYTLVSIGLTSFTAVAQFAPAILGGIFWRAGSRSGALAGLLAGFGVWLYTLVLPSLADAGYLPARFVTEGPFGIALLKPFSLFGLEALDRISHAVFWSMLANAGLYVGISMFSRPSAIEHAQAALFVDVFRQAEAERSTVWRGTASVPDLRSMLRRFLGRRSADRALSSYAAEHGIDWESAPTADSGLVNYAEKLLAGAIGSASARVMVGSIEKEAPLSVEEVMGILDETRQAIAYSRELERATAELKAANERLKELDRLKDEFLSTVTHELRTPLTSIRSIGEILHDNPDIGAERHLEFTDIIVRESQRLTRLITQVLDFQRIESGRMDWHVSRVDMGEVIAEAVSATRQLVEEKKITLVTSLDDPLPAVDGDRDRLVQVLVNLISNAVKFCEPEQGRIEIRAVGQDEGLRIDVSDNGPGIPAEAQESIFEEFRQIRSKSRGRPQGTGLGLSICRRIIAFHRGRIWAHSEPGQGATLSFYLPGEGASAG